MTDSIRLDIGCGDQLEEGWIGVDPYFNPPDDWEGTLLPQSSALDIRLADGTVDEIRSHHSLEHLRPNEIGAALTEWFRVLKSGGTLEIIVPDAVYCLQHFMDHPYSPWAYTIIHGRNDYPGDRHLTAFDAPSIQLEVRHAGFTVERCNKAWHDKWQQVSIVLWAVKP